MFTNYEDLRKAVVCGFEDDEEYKKLQLKAKGIDPYTTISIQLQAKFKQSTDELSQIAIEHHTRVSHQLQQCSAQVGQLAEAQAQLLQTIAKTVKDDDGISTLFLRMRYEQSAFHVRCSCPAQGCLLPPSRVSSQPFRTRLHGEWPE